MNPCKIDRSTHRFGAPANWNAEEAGHCAALHVRAEVMDGVEFMRSAWDMTPVEAVLLLAGGKLILGVGGSGDPERPSHPVVNMAVEGPADFAPIFTGVEVIKPDGQRFMRVEMILPQGRKVYAEVSLEGNTRAAAMCAAVENIEHLARQEGWI